MEFLSVGSTIDIKKCFWGNQNVILNVYGEVCFLRGTWKVCHFWAAADFC